MKKLLAIALIAASTTAFAGFSNTATTNTVSSSSGTTTVAQALQARDNSVVTLTGYIVSQVDHDEFYFKDNTGKIKVEIDDHVFNNQTVTRSDRITIRGKVDRDSHKANEVEVFELSKH
ncbi:YgiW/YdeI family stress tolerance OB fold protein [Lonepinella sp. BR2357]|uniref:YgiW/YdeI family stress tolerance OB fold protein n=1 Tax=Lonepinella sp. BR2357 TaxID=3434549 RepID=UPI003F6E1DC1